MARLIDADKAVAEAERLLELYNLAMANAENNREINHVFKRQELFKAVRAVVNTCPTIEPVKHGRWSQYAEPHEDGKGLYICSVCNEMYVMYDDEYKFCPNCGCKMDAKPGGDSLDGEKTK